MTKRKKANIVLAHGITSLFFLGISLFSPGSVDIAVHDTYYVMSTTFVLIIIAALFALFTFILIGIYEMSRPLSPILNWVHFGLTLGPLVIIILVGFELVNTRAITSINEWLAILILVIVLSQLVFIANLIRSFLLKKPIE